MARTAVTLYGVDAVKANLRRFGALLNVAGRRSVEYRWTAVLHKAQKLVPLDTHELHDSGRVDVSPKGMSATVVFGGPGIPQAIPVHEHLSEHSPYSWRVAEGTGRGVTFKPAGRGPKYLERPMMEAVNYLPGQFQEDLSVDKLL